MRDEFHSGLTYVRAHPALLWLAILGFAATFLGNPVLTFLPLFAQDVLHGDVSQYTYLMSSAGAGAVTGALVVAWHGRFPHMGRTALLIQATFGAIVVLFAMTRAFWLNATLLFVAGGCMVMVFATLSSLVQLNAPNEMRGRVMSLYMVAFRGGMPLGSLVSGWLAAMTSAPTVLIVNGLVLSAVALIVLTNNKAIREL